MKYEIDGVMVRNKAHELGQSLQDVASKSGLSTDTLRRIYAAKGRFNERTALGISKALHLNMKDIAKLA